MKHRGKRHDPIQFLAVGHVTIDETPHGQAIGGAAAYAALAASRLGLGAAILTVVGSDFPFWSVLDDFDIETHYSECESTTRFENRYHEGRRQQRLIGLAERVPLEHLTGLGQRLASDAAVLYCPVANELGGPLLRFPGEGLFGLAPQGFFRRWDEDGTIHQKNWPNAGAMLAGSDVVCLSDDDVPEVDVLAERFHGKAFVVTRGGEGARLYDGISWHDAPVFPVEAVDPTGAGDVFAAALLIGLREGRPTLDAARFASCAASFAVEGRGVASLATREAMKARLKAEPSA